jgi:cell pole-organizing protein PopZ
MVPAEANSEPSIEEILDSIRQIIADDDEGGTESAGAPPPAAAAKAPEKAPEKPAEKPPEKAAVQTPPADDIIELTERVQGPKASPPPPPAPEKKLIEIDMKEPEPEAAPPPVRATAPEPRRAMTPPPSDTADSLESIITKGAEAATMEAFSELAQRAAIEKGGGITIEDVVRYEIRPLLRAWIDKYLPGIVERLVAKELEKISNRFDD